MMPSLKIGKVARSAKEGREWLVLLLSLLLAFFIWSVHNLSLVYSVYFHYTLNVNTNLDGRKTSSQSPGQLILRGKASGFYILKNRYGNKADITINIDSKLLTLVSDEDDLFSVAGGDIREKVIEALANVVEVEYVANNTISLTFPKINYKKVPVKSKSSVSFKEQYMQIGKISLEPDSVFIYGEENILDKIDSVFTEAISLRQIDRSERGVVNLIHLRGVTYSKYQVYYAINVDRFIEKTYTLPVSIINAPEDRDFIFLPSTATVTCRQSFASKGEIGIGGMFIYVDYNDYIHSIDSKLLLAADSIPSDVYSVSINPHFVECVSIDRN